MNTLNWDDLRYFLALVQHGSLSASARALGVEHTTMARRIIQLEQGLGKKLFHRLPRGWQLTDEGMLLLEQAKPVEEQILRLQHALNAHLPLSGEVRVSMPPMLASHFLLPRLDGLRASLPGVQLAIIGEARRSDLLRGEADIAIRLGEPDVEDLAARRLGTVRFSWYVSAAANVPTSLQPPYIGFEKSFAENAQKIWCDKWLANRPCHFRSNGYDVMRVAIAQGWGAGILPDYLANREPGLRRLETPPGDTPPGSPVYLLIHPDVRRVVRVRAVADALIDIFTQADVLK